MAETAGPGVPTPPAEIAPVPFRAGAAAALVLFTFAAHAALVAIDTAPQTWDPAHHLLQAMRFSRDLAADGIGAIAAHWRAYHLYPPGGYLAGALAMALTGPSIAWARHLQAVPLALTVLLLYCGLARTGAARPALWAAAYLGAPLALAISRVTYLENLLALGVVALAVLLAASPALAGRRARITAGALLGAGVLVKWSFALFAVALFAAWILDVRGEPELRRARARGAFFAALVALPIAASWYVPHFRATFDDIFLHSYERTFDSPPLLSFASLFRYPVELLLGLGAPLCALFVFLVFGPAARRSAAGSHTRFLVVAVAGALLLLTFASHKQGRFLQPLLPLVVWIVGARIGASRLPILRGALLPAALVALDLGVQATPADCAGPLVRAPLPITFPGSLFPAGAPGIALGSIHRCDWGLDELTEILSTRESRAGVLLRPLDDHPYLNRKTLTTHVVAAGLRSVPAENDARWTVEARGPGATNDPAPPGFETDRDWLLPDGTRLRLAARISPETVRPAGSEVADAP